VQDEGVLVLEVVPGLREVEVEALELPQEVEVQV
jgi:hypothetical protein